MKNKPSQNSKIAMVRDASSAPDNVNFLQIEKPHCAHCFNEGLDIGMKADEVLREEGRQQERAKKEHLTEKQRLQEKLDWSIKVHELLDEYGYGKGSKERSKLLALTARLYCFIIGKEK